MIKIILNFKDDEMATLTLCIKINCEELYSSEYIKYEKTILNHMFNQSYYFI